VFYLLGQQSTDAEPRSAVCNDTDVEVSIFRAAQLYALTLLLLSTAAQPAAPSSPKTSEAGPAVKAFLRVSACPG